MVVEAGVVAGYVIAWAVRKARRAGGRADAEVDAAIDAGLDKLHAAVVAKLGAHPVLDDLVEEATAGEGQVSELTRQQVELAVVAAARKDEQFGREVTDLVTQLREAESASGAPVVAGGAGSVFCARASSPSSAQASLCRAFSTTAAGLASRRRRRRPPRSVAMGKTGRV